MTMTQEEIKKTWQEAATRFYAPAPDEFETMYRRKKETALERLAKKYQRFSRLGLMMGIISCFYLLPNTLFPTNMRIFIATFFTLYFCICSVMDYWLYKGVGSINCFTMTVKEVAEKAMYYKRKHLQFIMILLPLAILYIALLVYASEGNTYFIAGIAFGAIVGAAIGYRQYLDFMAQYKDLCE